MYVLHGRESDPDALCRHDSRRALSCHSIYQKGVERRPREYGDTVPQGGLVDVEPGIMVKGDDVPSSSLPVPPRKKTRSCNSTIGREVLASHHRSNLDERLLSEFRDNCPLHRRGRVDG